MPRLLPILTHLILNHTIRWVPLLHPLYRWVNPSAKKLSFTKSSTVSKTLPLPGKRENTGLPPLCFELENSWIPGLRNLFLITMATIQTSELTNVQLSKTVSAAFFRPWVIFTFKRCIALCTCSWRSEATSEGLAQHCLKADSKELCACVFLVYRALPTSHQHPPLTIAGNGLSAARSSTGIPGRTAQPLFLAALSPWRSPQNCATRIHSERSSCLWPHGRKDGIKREQHTSGTTKSICLLHQTCCSKQKFLLSKNSWFALDLLCFILKWLTLTHSN